MAISDRHCRIVDGIRPDAVPFEDLLAANEPVVLKGLVRDWPLTQAGLRTDDEAIDYLLSFYNGRTVGVLLGEPEIGGRYFYTDDLSGLNFVNERRPLDAILGQLRDTRHETPAPGLYVGSTTIDACLPGLRADNDVAFEAPLFARRAPLASIWIGNRSIASAHYDAPNNLACCTVGRRRFTLFPPEQIVNLYPGPLEPTPGGQAVSMVDFSNPDFERHPRFREAMAAAQVAELEPGDALFYPSLWWHHVEALSPFNVLINYWWNSVPETMGSPMNALHHALLSLRDRPQTEKAAWRAVFDYYVFGDAERPRAHLPPPAWGSLAPIDDTTSRRLRAMLLNRLNR